MDLLPPPPLPPVLGDVQRQAAAVAPGGPRAVALDPLAAPLARIARAQLEAHRRYLDAASEGLGLALRRLGAPEAPGPGPRPPALDRAALERFATGRAADVFGPAWADLDGRPARIRLAAPPLLLVDRVVLLDGCAERPDGARIVTEYDVPEDAWFLHAGRMPAGILMEAAQGHAVLFSWLGLDRRGGEERRYRFLGGEARFDGALPRGGERLRVEIVLERLLAEGDRLLVLFSGHGDVEGRRAFTLSRALGGFFTQDELAAASAQPWRPEPATGEPHSPGPAVTSLRSFGEEALRAFQAGRPRACFGESHRVAGAHRRSPAPTSGRLGMIDRVVAFDPDGGAFGRGLSRAERDLAPREWFHACHFADDPCLPGNLVSEGCLQLMAFHMAACGWTLERDAWRFEPEPGVEHRFAYEAQAPLGCRRLELELHARSMRADPWPTLRADVRVLADGAPILRARIGLRLVPGWPIEERPRVAGTGREAFASGGLVFDEATILCFALGRPSLSLGSAGEKLEAAGLRMSHRAPAPPLLFVSRARDASVSAGEQRAGATAELEYDVPRGEWYLQELGGGEMPFAVLLEIALQSCGWFSSYMLGARRDPAHEAFFRNLDGRLSVVRHVGPDVERLTVKVASEGGWSAGGASIERFRFRVLAGEALVAEGTSVFGTFGAAALAEQVGLPAPEDVARGAASNRDLALRAPGWWRDGPRRIAGEKLLLVERITGTWEGGGRHGRGRWRASMPVDPEAWYFRAHFFGDPVQPGSVGLESLLALLRFAMVDLGLDRGLLEPCFEPLATPAEVSWSYRGQVLPGHREVTLVLDLVEAREDAGGATATAEGWLFLDGRCIYRAGGLSARLRGTRPAGGRETGRGYDEERVRGWWRRRLGVGAWPGEDLVRGLLRSYVGRVVVADPGALAALAGRPCLLLANHQVGVESVLFTVVASALLDSAVNVVAKAAHRDTWIGKLLRVLHSWPGVRDPELMIHFERSDPAAMLEILARMRRLMAEEAHSLLVHAEGTRALGCRAPVRTLSSVFVDLCLAEDVPIVPVRFAGGLPVEPAAERLEFPIGHGAQDYWIGTPIFRAELEALRGAARRERVLEALNALGPPPALEVPSAPDEALGARVRDLVERAGLAETRAAVLASLERVEGRDPRLDAWARAALEDGPVPAGEGAEWFEALRRWAREDGAPPGRGGGPRRTGDA